MTETIMAFYKGTALTMALNVNIKYPEIRKMWEEQIVCGLRCGEKLKDLIELYKGQLDAIEEAWFTSEKLFAKDIDKRIKFVETVCSTHSFGTFNEITVLWCMNIASLIKLKAIECDDMNGFVVLTM